MKILAVNWLDRLNPMAGGAEIHFHEIFERLVAMGHEVTMVTSGWDGCSPREAVGGIDVLRFGGRYTFAFHGRGAVRRQLQRESYDVMVEDINKLPLLLANVAPLPMYVIVPHLFGSTAFQAESVPVASLVWIAERPVPRVYRKAAFHAISESTRDDLVARGVAATAIRVIHPGVDATRFTPDPAVCRGPEPSFLYIGRLKRYKGVDTAIRAIGVARAQGHRLRLDIAGQGDDEGRLRSLVGQARLGDQVRFLGFVSEDRKLELLRRTWAVVLPSPKEGWGITNVEAAACGTPAVASDSPGLRESVRSGQTGLLVPHGDTAALAAAMNQLAGSPDLVTSLGAAARRFAEGLSWESSATKTETHLLETINERRA